MSNLVLDIGNTAVKLFIFEHDVVVWQSHGSKENASLLAEALTRGPVQKVIVSAVAQSGEVLERALSELQLPILRLTSETPVPIKNNYSTPRSLGTDRLAAVVGAHELFPQSDVLVIDAGTCITYDWIDCNGIYQGGNIAPGMKMRFEAMNQFTERLPEVKFQGKWPKLMGQTTEEALLGGVMWGMKAEIEAYIDSLRESIPTLKVVFTGGDGCLFQQYINKMGTQADELLVARGLNRILKYNESI